MDASLPMTHMRLRKPSILIILIARQQLRNPMNSANQRAHTIMNPIVYKFTAPIERHLRLRPEPILYYMSIY